MRLLFCAVLSAAILLVPELRAAADGGPDHWAVTGIASGGVLDIFAEPSTNAPKLGAIPPDHPVFGPTFNEKALRGTSF